MESLLIHNGDTENTEFIIFSFAGRYRQMKPVSPPKADEFFYPIVVSRLDKKGKLSDLSVSVVEFLSL